MSEWFHHACPTCKVPKGQRCRTLTTGRVTDVHVDRVPDLAGLPNVIELDGRRRS